ncbi:MAG TPA: N-6 DNA methylase [Methanocella sp.]|nr:N-6 DNA methylase [Methanocella sp.]
MLVDSLAAESFSGDRGMAKACAERTLIQAMLIGAGFSEEGSHSPVPDGKLRDIVDLADAIDDPTLVISRLIDISGSRFAGRLSRDTGVVYTPDTVARFISCRAIDNWLLGHIAENAGNTPYMTIDDLACQGSSTERGYASELLDSVRLLDSSCGTGVFLQWALKHLLELKALFNGSTIISRRMIEDALSDNIYGIDIDKNALDVARARLLLAVLPAVAIDGPDTGKIRTNLVHGNALFSDGEALKENRYDIIVGNPPYMRVKSMFRGEPDRRELRNAFASSVWSSGLYRLQDGNLNLYKLFIERNLALLKSSGSLGIIIPSPFLNEATSTRLRQHIFTTCKVEEIVEIPEAEHVFDGISQAAAIIFCRSVGAGNRVRLRTGVSLKNLDGNTITINLEKLNAITRARMEVPLLSSPDIEWELLNDLINLPRFWGDSQHLPVGNISVGNLDETIDREFISDDPADDIFVKGIHLREYHVDLSPDGARPRWVNKAGLIRKRPSAAKIIEMPRIIGRNTLNKSCPRRLKFAMLPPGYICGNSIKQIIVTNPEIQPQYLLGLLNSAVLNWYFEIFCSQNNIRNYSIEALPMPRAVRQEQDAIALVAGMIIDATGTFRRYLDQKLMDSLVYELYFKKTRALSSLIQTTTIDEARRDGLCRRNILDALDPIMKEPGFQVIQQVAYRRQT